MKRTMAINIAQYIDHTLLKPTATLKEIQKLCQEAAEHKFASVCIHPFYVPASAHILRQSPVKICTVIGFPLGCNDSMIKSIEAKRAVQNGAKQIDMVMNMSAFKSAEYDDVLKDIKGVVDAVQEQAIVKVILQTCYLDVLQIKKASQISMKAGSHFVKTSTGFGTGGATIQALKAMKDVVGDKLGIKASGGIRSYQTAVQMLEAGATRLGTSSGVEIVKGEKSERSY